MKRILLAAAVALLAAGCRQTTNERSPTPGVANPPAAPSANAAAQPRSLAAQTNGAPDALFTPQLALNRLHAINQEEIEAGRLAQQNGTARIGDFGKQLVTDHQSMDGEVSSVAGQLKVSLQDADKVSWPAPVQQQLQSDKQKMTELRSLRGDAFDKQFLTMMIDGHTQALDYLKQLQSNAKELPLKTLANGAAPKVQAHLTRAQELTRSNPRTQGRR